MSPQNNAHLILKPIFISSSLFLNETNLENRGPHASLLFGSSECDTDPTGIIHWSELDG